MQSCLSKQPFGRFPHGSITGFELEFSNPVISLHLYECRAGECDQRSVQIAGLHGKMIWTSAISLLRLINKTV